MRRSKIGRQDKGSYGLPLAITAVLIPSAARMSASPSSTGEGGRIKCKGLAGVGEYKMACFRVALSRSGRDLFHNISTHTRNHGVKAKNASLTRP